MSKFSKLSQNQTIHTTLFFSFLLAPYVTVPVVLRAEACPFASSSTASLSTMGLNVLCVQKTLTLTLNGGGGEQMGTLGKERCLG